MAQAAGLNKKKMHFSRFFRAVSCASYSMMCVCVKPAGECGGDAASANHDHCGLAVGLNSRRPLLPPSHAAHLPLLLVRVLYNRPRKGVYRCDDQCGIWCISLTVEQRCYSEGLICQHPAAAANFTITAAVRQMDAGLRPMDAANPSAAGSNSNADTLFPPITLFHVYVARFASLLLHVSLDSVRL